MVFNSGTLDERFVQGVRAILPQRWRTADSMSTSAVRPRYTIFGGVVLLVIFLIVAYQNVIVTLPSLRNGAVIVYDDNDRNNSVSMINSDFATKAMVTVARSSAKSTAKAVKRRVNPKDFAPYSPVFVNASVNGKSFKVDKYLVDSEGCRILNMNPRDPTLDDIIIDDQDPFPCPSTTVSGPANVTGGLVFIRDGMLRVDNATKSRVLKHYDAYDEGFLCQVEYMKRFPVEQDDWINRTPDKATEFKYETKVMDEFMKIQCFVNISTIIYETYDFAVLRKNDVEARCEAITKLQKEKGTFCEDQLSVLLLGVDSLSRLTSMRHLSKSRKVLESMDAIEFLGYNKIGPNTFPNMFGFLTGRKAKDLKLECWNDDVVFDNCTFLWDSFSAAGYRTSFVENMEYFGLFTYAMKGFRRQPADYYGRVFFIGAKNLLKPYVNACIRNVSEDEALFEWAVEFQKEFANDKHFGYFWISLFSHDNFNDIQQIDPFLSKDLNIMRRNNMLNNTLLIVMGDHGPRYGSLMGTKVGKFESNLPPMFLVFPKWFQKKYPNEMRTLRVNARNRMVTHLDLHRTLKDIINCSVANEPGVEPIPQRHQAVSLFRPIAESRTCFDAGIDEKYCGCRKKEVNVKTDSDIAVTISNLVVEQLNNITSSQRDLCAELSLNETQEVKARLTGTRSKVNSKDDTTFVVTLTTTPGGGKFWAYVYFTKIDGQFKVDDEILRINAYGNSSSCITSPPQLLPICLCIDQLS